MNNTVDRSYVIISELKILYDVFGIGRFSNNVKHLKLVTNFYT